MAAHEGTQHPIRVYLWIWLLLFVLSTFSYLVDYFHVQGALRWTLIIVFMFLKASLIVASNVLRGHYERGGDYSAVEIAGLYWHFVDLVWVFIFALFYLW